MTGRPLVGEPAGVGAALVGRAATLRRLDRCLDDAAGAVVGGPGGVGVSALLTATARLRRGDGVAVDHRVASDPLDDLLGGDGPGPLLVLDDAHLLDEPTAAGLRRAVLDGRLRCLLGSTQPERLASPLEWLWQSGTLERVDLLPLDAAAVAGWVADLVGAPPDRATLEVLVDDSGGLPGLLVDTLAALTVGAPAGLVERSGYARLSGSLPCPVALARRVRRRADGLASDGHEVLAAACVTGRLGPPMWDLPAVATWTEELTRRGLISWSGPPGDRWLRPAVGAVRRVVLDDLGPIGIARAAARLLTDTPDPLPIDRQLWVALADPRSVPGPDHPSAVSVARHLMAERRLDEAEIVARAAADQGDLAATVVQAELRAERADWSGAAAVLTRLLEHPDLDDVLRVRAVHELASLWLWDFDRADEAVGLVRDAASRTGGLGGPATAALVEITVQAGRIDEGMAQAEELDTMGHRPTVTTQAAVALARGLSGELDRAVASAQENLARCLDPPAGQPADEPESTVLALALSLTEGGRVDEAAELGAAGYELVGGHPPDLGWMALARGRVALVRGDLAAAETFGRESEAIFGDLDDVTPWRWAVAVQLYVAGVRGQDRRCRELEARIELVGPSGVAFLDPDVARARAWADYAQGDTLAARRRLVEAGSAAEQTGNRTLAMVVWYDALRLGERRSAPAALHGLVGRVSGRASAAVAAHLRAMESEDPGRWVDAARAMGEAGRSLEAAELANQAIEVGNRRRDRLAVRTARGLLEAAVAVCRGASTPLLATGTASLTSREREVAHLAADGASSRRIASELGISVRTVDNLLGRTYVKLGIRRRADLGAALDPDAGRSPVP